ncbi:alpha-amylase family glycosyl hydrolase [Deinococcus koreensis]|uniref:Alpha-glycosidase n=1 Tax=Deinococcus koreensis TaxID=2054903 RepID=A0A2K3USX2_9DEIO|nr:alpha-amylase family glycosyl hydrolase [Deinococcus koreensis]PNY79643.1 alpha-glycosidase [Deinococcus koreensis]
MFPAFTADPAAWHDATEAHTCPATAEIGGTVTLRLRTRLRPRRVQVLELRHGEILAFAAHPCEAPYEGWAEKWYAYDLRLGSLQNRYIWRLDFEEDMLFVSTAGLKPVCPGYRDWYSVLADYQPPEWVWESVFYQIFPDRFRRGGSHPRPEPGAYAYPQLHPEVIGALSPGRSELERAALGAFPLRTPDWDEPLSIAEDAHTLYGGDLAGVQDALPYLEALGINALWLNPIFRSPSSHRYDTSDYREVDPHLGGEVAFDHLSTALRRRGMRLVLDGVFNHLGNEHALFQRAMADPQAPERDYFTFRAASPGQLPYHGFYDVPTLPKLDYTHEAAYREFIDGPDSVTRHWLRRGIDGWRLDVAQGMGTAGTDGGNLEILRRLKRAAREENPQAYVLGERFFDAEHALQDGRGEDGVMNYHGFGLPVMTWLTGRDKDGEPQRIDTEALVAHLWDAYRVLPLPVALNQFNLLESHDIARALYRLDGNAERYLGALGLLMAYPGAPCLYYGSEIGLSQPHGDSMNYARATFPWEESAWNRELLEGVRRLVQLRRSLPALQRGSLRFVGVGEHSFALLRELGEGGTLSRVMCLVSRSPQTTTLDLYLPPGGWRDLESGELTGVPGAEGSTRLSWQGTRLLIWESPVDQLHQPSSAQPRRRRVILN